MYFLLKEKIISQIGNNKVSINDIDDKKTLESLKKRPNFIIEDIEKSQTISLSENAKSISFDSTNSGAIDVEADAPKIFVGPCPASSDIAYPFCGICAQTCAFGGENLETLYITSASVDMNTEERKRYKLAGSIFKVKPGVKGVKSSFFGQPKLK